MNQEIWLVSTKIYIQFHFTRGQYFLSYHEYNYKMYKFMNMEILALIPPIVLVIYYYETVNEKWKVHFIFFVAAFFLQ